MRERSYWPLDQSPQTKGDGRFIALNMSESPGTLPVGFYSQGDNVRVELGQLVSRLGVQKIPWANLDNMPTDERIKPFNRIYGIGKFLDPNGLAWILIATDQGIYRTRPNNQVQLMSLPSGEVIEENVQFVQAYDVCMALRADKVPLYLTDIDAAWKKVTQAALWDSAKVYTYGDEVLFGDVTYDTGSYLDRAVTTLARSSNVVTCTTTADHGFSTGDTISVRGAVETGFNGRWEITVTGSKTFTYTSAGSNVTATGTIYTAPDNAVFRCVQTTSAGDSPRSVAAKWVTVANTDPIPNSSYGLYTENRLFLVHDRDQVAASDVLDYTHYVAQLQDLRVNTGTSDSLLAIVPFSETVVIAFKESSIHAIWNVYGDLADVRLDEITREFGLAGAKAVTRVGNQLWFLASDGSIRALMQTSQNKIQVGRMRLSDPVKPLMDRLAWSSVAGGSTATAVTWDGRVYFALPIDSGETTGNDITDVSNFGSTGQVTIPTIIGQRYRWLPGANETGLVFAKLQSCTITRVSTTATATCVAHGFSTGDQIKIEGATQTEYNGVHEITVLTVDTFTFTVSGTPATPATGTITACPNHAYLAAGADFVAEYSMVYVRGATNQVVTQQLLPVWPGNNAVLVGRALPLDWSESSPGSEFSNDIWMSLDTGRSLAIADWLTFNVDARVRLLCSTVDGYMQIYEQGYWDTDPGGDYPSNPSFSREPSRAPIDMS